MKLGKTWLLLTAAVLFLCLSPALAADPFVSRIKAQVLKQGSEKLEALFGGSEGKAIGESVGLFKQSGLSYQPSLVVPLEGIVDCKDKEQLRVLMGMYLFDSNYALLFGRKQEFSAAIALREAIPDRMNLGGRLKIKTFTPDELKKIADNPDDPANRDLYVKYVVANMQDSLQAAKSDQEIMEAMVDTFYGAVLEGVYVACKLALSAGPGHKFVALFNDQAMRLDKFQEALGAYTGDPELDGLVKRTQRQPVLKPVIEILKTRKGNLPEADVKKILSSIEPERKKLVGKCK
ncbi:MAG: hypothetical protein CVU57_01550 [Deltaproteobacteria bacterium HGW-Deltaproteobacteria-15]|jgi:hypothetical protein|nr:MAG: hypothetical protein CVU57_01550 [Deltaproteobacteria bacterium HGW-Deltaproteobacteria-15]